MIATLAYVYNNLTELKYGHKLSKTEAKKD